MTTARVLLCCLAAFAVAGYAGGVVADDEVSTGVGVKNSSSVSAHNIHHLVFVIDRRASMVRGESDLLAVVKHQMRITIRQIKEAQDFHIVFLSATDDKPLEMESRAMIAGTATNKKDAMAFLDTVQAVDTTDPIPALKRAIAVLDTANENKGKQIFLLTDGDFPDNDAVLKFLKENAKGVLVNTYLFDPAGKSTARGPLLEIAKTTGGIFKHITEVDLAKYQPAGTAQPAATQPAATTQPAGGNETGVVIRAGGVDSRIGPATPRPVGAVRFFGINSVADVHQVVFVIDRGRTMELSESHGNFFKLVKHQIRITVRQLKEKQAFHIVYFSGPDDEPLEMKGRALVLATEKNKVAAMDFIDDIPAQERTDPLPALKRAVAVLKDPAAETTTQPTTKPTAQPTTTAPTTQPTTTAAADKNKQIFLLTDGDFPDNDAVVKFVKENCEGITINTYLIGANLPPTARDTMMEIAKMTGGIFKAIELD